MSFTFDFGPGSPDEVPEHLSTDSTKVRHALSSKEGWSRFVSRTVVRPKAASLSQLATLDARRRAEYDALRMQFHRTLVITQHSQLTDMWQRMSSVVMGQYADDGSGMGIAMSGGPGHGKTATAVGFCAEYERQLRTRYPAAFLQENEVIPVIYSSLVRGAGLKSQMEHILGFVGGPSSRRATGTQLVDRLVDVLNSCQTRILCLDQAQNLHAGDKKDDEVAACLKEVMDASHATLVLIGIDIDSAGPLAVASGGRLQASNDRLQLARRFTHLRMERVAKESQEWRDLLSSIESQLVLANARPGDLSEALADHIWNRCSGAIGVAFNMLRGAANAAISNGEERITKRSLTEFPLTIEAARTKRVA